MKPKKGQLKFFRQTNLERVQMSEILPKKGQSGNLCMSIVVKQLR